MKIAQDMAEEWFVVIDEPNCVSTAGKKALHELRDSEFIDCNSEINARLIAAAPELLGALDMLLSWERTGSPDSNTCFSRAQSAVAKARFGLD